MSKAESINLLASLARESQNGMETQVCVRYTGKCSYSWVMIRYSAALEADWHDAEIIRDFAGCGWPEIAEFVQAYLDAHSADGFWWN